MGKFNKGLFFGGLMGAALMWMSTTKKGKEVRGQLLDHGVKAYEKVKELVLASETFDTLTKSKYVEKVKEVVDRYAIENGSADRVKELLQKVLA